MLLTIICLKRALIKNFLKTGRREGLIYFGIRLVMRQGLLGDISYLGYILKVIVPRVSPAPFFSVHLA